MNIPYKSSTLTQDLMPDIIPMHLISLLKLLLIPRQVVLYGGQCIGIDGVDKRIDQLALLIKTGGTVYDLMKLEHAYAPPFSSAKDPIAIAGYVANNIINGKMPVVYWRDIKNTTPDTVTLLDVRTKEEFKLGSIPGAINIPVDELRLRYNDIPIDKPVYIYCQIG